MLLKFLQQSMVWASHTSTRPDQESSSHPKSHRHDKYIGKTLTQRNERTNGILRQQTGSWHRRQNKFGKVWQQTEVTVRLVVSDFNWSWQHSQLKTTAAQRAGLKDISWSWADLVTYPTLL